MEQKFTPVMSGLLVDKLNRGPVQFLNFFVKNMADVNDTVQVNFADCGGQGAGDHMST